MFSESTLQFSQLADSINGCGIKVVLFSDKRGPVLVVFSAKDGLDFEALTQVTGRELKLDSGLQYKKQLCGFSIRNLPPFGRMFQIKMIADERLSGYEDYLIDIGEDDCFLEVNRRGFDTLLKGAGVFAFSQQASDAKALSVSSANSGKMSTLLTVKVVESMFANGQSLPAMPGVGAELLQLKGSRDFDFEVLVRLIETDPVLSAKILSYASSPFFAYQGKLSSVKEAIYHVLGIELSLNIALALAVGGQFQGPLKGAVGAAAIWRQSVYCAVLSQLIADKLKSSHEINSGTAYLHGLLHNIGFLVLGHLFPTKVTGFNKSIKTQPQIAMSQLEADVLGISHTEVGRLLMDHWVMPEAYKTVVIHHHDAEYTGLHETYVHVVYLANALLKGIDIGDALDDLLPSNLLEKYALTEEELKEMRETLLQWNENIDLLAQQLAA